MVVLIKTPFFLGKVASIIVVLRGFRLKTFTVGGK